MFKYLCMIIINMVEASIIGINLPFYIIATLIFSFIVWAKFLSKGSTIKIKTAEDLLQILSLEFIFLPVLTGFSFVFRMFSEISSYTLDISATWKLSELFVSMIILALLYLLLTYYPKESNKDDLKLFFKKLIVMEFVILAVIGGIIVGLLLSDYAYLVGDVLVYMALPALLVVGITFPLLEKFHEVKIEFSKDLIILMLIFFILSIFLIKLITPNVQLGDESITQIHIYDSYGVIAKAPQYQESYSEVEIPLKIKHLGILSSKFAQIPIPYHRFSNSRFAEANFKVESKRSDDLARSSLLNGFNYLDNINKDDGFSEAKTTPSKKTLIFKFNDQLKKSKINYLYITGYKKINITEKNYSYSSNSKQNNACDEDNCTIWVNVTHNMTSRLTQHEFTLVNLKEISILDNYSNCDLTNISSSYKLNSSLSGSTAKCSKNTCIVEIYDNDKNKEVFNMIIVKSEQVIKLTELKMDGFISISSKLTVTC